LSLFALKAGQAFSFSFEPYSIVKVLLFFQLYHPTKGTLVKLKRPNIVSDIENYALQKSL